MYAYEIYTPKSSTTKHDYGAILFNERPPQEVLDILKSRDENGVRRCTYKPCLNVKSPFYPNLLTGSSIIGGWLVRREVYQKVVDKLVFCQTPFKKEVVLYAPPRVVETTLLLTSTSFPRQVRVDERAVPNSESEVHDAEGEGDSEEGKVESEEEPLEDKRLRLQSNEVNDLLWSKELNAVFVMLSQDLVCIGTRKPGYRNAPQQLQTRIHFALTSVAPLTKETISEINKKLEETGGIVYGEGIEWTQTEIIVFDEDEVEMNKDNFLIGHLKNAGLVYLR